jgi:hypothetical protein
VIAKVDALDVSKSGRANWLFCSDKFTAERIMDKEEPHAFVTGQVKKNHSFLCTRWLKKREPALKMIHGRVLLEEEAVITWELACFRGFIRLPMVEIP